MSGKLAYHYIEPAAPSQPKKAISARRSAPTPLPSKPQRLIKRRSSVSDELEDKLCKKPRVPTEAAIALSQAPSTEEVSKYFSTVNPRKSKIQTPQSGSESRRQTPLGKSFGKENIQPKPKEAPALDFKLKVNGNVVSPVKVCEKLGNEEDVLVAQGWRAHYSLKPQAAATHLASLMSKANAASGFAMRTPLQRIGANAMQGNSRPTPGKPPGVVQEVVKSDQRISIQRFAMGSSHAEAEEVAEEVVHGRLVGGELNTPEETHRSVFLEKFLYNPS